MSECLGRVGRVRGEGAGQSYCFKALLSLSLFFLIKFILI